MTQFTKIIRQRFQLKSDSFKALAKSLKISEHFAKHILYSEIVPLSPRVISGLSKRYRLPLKSLEKMAKKRNKIGREYYRKWRAKSA